MNLENYLDYQIQLGNQVIYMGDIDYQAYGFWTLLEAMLTLEYLCENKYSNCGFTLLYEKQPYDEQSGKRQRR